MIAATDPQEFVPGGRQQALRHPGPISAPPHFPPGIGDEFLRRDFARVAISDSCPESAHSEWWTIRRVPNVEDTRRKYNNNVASTGRHSANNNAKHKDKSHGFMEDSSWSLRCGDVSGAAAGKLPQPPPPRGVHKRVSDVSRYLGSNKRFSTESEKSGYEANNKSTNDYTRDPSHMEEELYVRGNLTTWTRGLSSNPIDCQTRVTVCSYSSSYPVQQALWCRFYCDRPTLEGVVTELDTTTGNDTRDRLSEVQESHDGDYPRGTPVDSVAILDGQCLKVFAVDSEDFSAMFPFRVRKVWSCKFGVILERDCKDDNKDITPTIFHLSHPLDDATPMALHHGSTHLVEDSTLEMVFTSDSPSVAMIYDTHTKQHTVYRVRKLRKEECFHMPEKMSSYGTTGMSYNISNKFKNRLSSLLDGGKGSLHPIGVSPFTSGANSVASMTSQHPSRTHSPMPAMSRCATPIISPLVTSSPWLLKNSRLTTSLRNCPSGATSTIATDYHSQIQTHHLNPKLCFDHLWTDSPSHDSSSNSAANKVFLMDDFTGQWYLSYHIISRQTLCVVSIDFSKEENITFGVCKSIAAKDATAIPHLHMMALLEHSGNVMLYSGLHLVGKLHIGGVLAQHVPSPFFLRRSFKQFNSPFPRRSSLLPHCGTPLTDPKFDLFSPVLPDHLGKGSNMLHIPSQRDYNIQATDSNNSNNPNQPSTTRMSLSRLRDTVSDRITLHYTDGTYYRVTLPSVTGYRLVDSCLNVIRATLCTNNTGVVVANKDKDGGNLIVLVVMAKWYATKNAPGPREVTAEKEWGMFEGMLLELLGYTQNQQSDGNKSSESNTATTTPSGGAAKRQRHSSSGTDSDWLSLCTSTTNTTTSYYLSEILGLKNSAATENDDCKYSKNTQETTIDNTAILFPYIKVLHYILHLLYEDLKLDVLRTDELPLLVRLLHKLAGDLHLVEYQVSYWRDFPLICKLGETSPLSSKDLSPLVVTWPCLSEHPPSILNFLEDLVTKPEAKTTYPYYPPINSRTRDVVQLCGGYIHGIYTGSSTVIPGEGLLHLVTQESNPSDTTLSINDFLVQITDFKTDNTRESSTAERIVLLMAQMALTARDLERYPASVGFVLYEALWSCRETPPNDWPAEAYQLLQRSDLAAQAQIRDLYKPENGQTVRHPMFSHINEVLPTSSASGRPTSHGAGNSVTTGGGGGGSSSAVVAATSGGGGVAMTEDDYEDGMEDVDSPLLRLRFAEDRRVSEARRLLHSSKPVPIVVVQRPDVSDHDFIEEQEKHLYAICTRTMALPVGRGMFTLRTATPVITEPLPAPPLCLTGTAPPRATTVDLAHIDVPAQMNAWPLFHNGVASGLRVARTAPNIDSTWIVFNRPRGTTPGATGAAGAASTATTATGATGVNGAAGAAGGGVTTGGANSVPGGAGGAGGNAAGGGGGNPVESLPEHAGFLLALGLNGHLGSLAVLQRLDYLVKVHEMTSVGILLGLSVSYRGTANTALTKMLAVHCEALLPPTAMELDVPQHLQVAALLGVGLVHQGTGHRHTADVLLAEIGRPPGPDMENSVDRESYALAAGLALGLVTLQQGGELASSGSGGGGVARRKGALADLAVPETLHYYMVGGNKRPLTGSQKDKYKVPSFQIKEGSSVNLDITAPGATLALGLMYLGSNNKAIADWMDPPDTQYLLDFVRPDFLMLRTLSRSLIMWRDIKPDASWVKSQVPETILPFCMVKPTDFVDVDYEAMNQAYCNIVAGACFAIGLKYAGTANEAAHATLLEFCHMFISLTAKSIAELAGKPTIETCLNVLLLSDAMVMAGTGNLEIMRIVRHLRRRVGVASCAVVTYGSHLAVHMALGLLFLGGGRYTLSNSPASVAALICAFYPKFPTHSNDNRYHLQAFRHLYVLAVEPRLVIPKDITMGRMCYANITVVRLDGVRISIRGPGMIPDLGTLYKVAVDDERYWPVTFEKGRNWEQLIKLLSTCACIEVKQRAGCLSYTEDQLGYRSDLAHTLNQSVAVPWDPPPSAILSFSSDCIVRHFTDHFLRERGPLRSANALRDDSSNETEEGCLRQSITRAVYECVVRDKLSVLPFFVSFIKTVHDLQYTSHHPPNPLQLSHLKLVISLVGRLAHKDPTADGGSFPSKSTLATTETILSLRQQTMAILDRWISSNGQTRQLLRGYLQGRLIAGEKAENKTRSDEEIDQGKLDIDKSGESKAEFGRYKVEGGKSKAQADGGKNKAEICKTKAEICKTNPEVATNNDKSKAQAGKCRIGAGNKGKAQTDRDLSVSMQQCAVYVSFHRLPYGVAVNGVNDVMQRCVRGEITAASVGVILKLLST